LDFSKLALIVRRKFRGAIPAIGKTLWRGVLFRHPVIMWQDSFSAMSTFFTWMDLQHTGLAYSSTDKHNANADTLRVNKLIVEYELKIDQFVDCEVVFEHIHIVKFVFVHD